MEFHSLSEDKKSSRNFCRVEIGPHVASFLIAAFDDHESEVLFNPGTIFDIVGQTAFNPEGDSRPMLVMKALRGKQFYRSHSRSRFVSRSRSRSPKISPARSFSRSPTGSFSRPKMVVAQLKPIEIIKLRFQKWFDKLARNTVISEEYEGDYNSKLFKELYRWNIEHNNFKEENFSFF